MIRGDLWSKVDKTETCWLWTAAKNAYGYGIVRIAKKNRYAHRHIYELLVGPIAVGLDLDHLCRVRNCVNPAHLEPVSRRENLLRGETISKRNADVTHCPQGHEYTPENTYVRRRKNRSGEIRFCRACAIDKASHFRRVRKQREHGRVLVPATPAAVEMLDVFNEIFARNPIADELVDTPLETEVA